VSAAAPSRARVRLRDLSFDDYEQVVALTSRYGLGRRTEDEWRHVWVNNPAWHERWPLGWVLENTEGRVVGSMSSVPLAYELDGRPVVASSGRAWVVDEEYRAYASLLLDELFHQPGVDLWLNTTVNRHAAPVYALFDSPPVPAGHWDRAAFWITNYRGFAQSALRTRAPGFAALLSWPAGAALWAKDLLARADRLDASGAYEVGLESGFDERFDTFWSALREQRQGVLQAVRSRAVLEWHFAHHLRLNHVWIWTASQNGRMVAYAIFYRKDKPALSLARMRFVDFQYLEDHSGAFLPMLERMLEICRREGIHMLEDMGCAMPDIPAPHSRALPSWLFHYKASGALAETLRDPLRWEPTLFDGDSSL